MKLKFMFLAVQPLQPSKKNGEVYPRVELVIDDETGSGTSTVVSCDRKAYDQAVSLKPGDTKFGNFAIKASYGFRAPELVFMGLDK